MFKVGMNNKQMKAAVAKKTAKKWPPRKPVNDNDADDMPVKKNKKKSGPIKTSGSFEGKSNTLGHGGRAAQMRARGVPGGVIGAIARSEGAAPGGPNYHGKKKSLTKKKK